MDHFYDVRYLLERRFHRIGSGLFDPAVHNNFAIRWAADAGDIELVERLMHDRRVDPSVNNAGKRILI
jgi:hypothetical protein